MVELLFKELSELKEVEAIALGGSRAGENYDENINIITILGIFEDMTEFDNYIEALENTHKLPD